MAMPPLKADAAVGFPVCSSSSCCWAPARPSVAVGRSCPQRCPSVLGFGWWLLSVGQRVMPALLSRLPQDLSYNQLTECPRELENAKNMLVLNLGHNRWVQARAAISLPLAMATAIHHPPSLRVLHCAPHRGTTRAGAGPRQP